MSPSHLRGKESTTAMAGGLEKPQHFDAANRTAGGLNISSAASAMSIVSKPSRSIVSAAASRTCPRCETASNSSALVAMFAPSQLCVSINPLMHRG